MGATTTRPHAERPLRIFDHWTFHAMPQAIQLDVRGLEPPEPMVRVLEALDTLGAGDSLLVKIDRQPMPLYRLLQRHGYFYEERSGSDSLFEIVIRLRENA